ncbi:MAG: cytochrome c [Acidobacteriia bacterium]|nr:cytochrome c [Terriglobia bacterium]
MKLFIAGVILGVLGFAAGIWFYFSTGMVPVAVSDTDMPFEALLARKALHARIVKQGDKPSPVPADEKNLLAGATVYVQNCAVCHGLPGQPKTTIAEGLYPKPPQLFKGHGVTDDPASETYWKAANGIRLTGMPGFKSTLSETQLWQVSQLLANADKITEPVKKALAPPAPAPAASGPAH